jgi:ADP-dependent NAD(P)H-hydrate dehydratase / NAD(P)H-hydrate epimerase
VLDLYTPQQVRAMDQRAFDRGIAPLDLMERAAGHLARSVLTLAGYGYGLRVTVLCGRGNNGGDGLAAARRLIDAGAEATVCLVAGSDRLSDDAAAQLARWHGLGGRVETDPARALAGADVAADCMLGTGTAGALRDPYAGAVAALDRSGLPVVACDLPSGVDADSGAVPGPAVRAEATLTLGAHKRGLHLWPARGHCGELILGNLGIVTGDDDPVAWMLEAGDAAALVPPLPPDTEKRRRGVVTVVAGAPGMAGAAGLVARGALAGGAGLVTVAAPDAVLRTVGAAVPEALTLRLPDDAGAAWEPLAEQLAASDALAVGPGLGLAEPTVRLVRRLVREIELPVVLDADGLNAYRHDGDALARHASRLLVCTPHAREFARLVGTAEGGSDPGVWDDRATVAPDRAKAWGAVVVAKGPGSLIAAPDGRVWVNPTGGPSLATGGTGDVLTGLLAALAAQRTDPATVAAGVYLHGLAGELAGGGRAARSVTALDVARAIPAALRRLDRDGGGGGAADR